MPGQSTHCIVIRVSVIGIFLLTATVRTISKSRTRKRFGLLVEEEEDLLEARCRVARAPPEHLAVPVVVANSESMMLGLALGTVGAPSWPVVPVYDFLPEDEPSKLTP